MLSPRCCLHITTSAEVLYDSKKTEELFMTVWLAEHRQFLVARVAPRADAAEGLARALVARCARSSRTARKSATLVARVAHVILVSGAPAQTYNNHTKLWLCGLSYSLQPSSAHNAATGAPGASGGVIKKTQ